MSTLDRLFAEQVARTPQAAAVVDAHQALTYLELDQRANHLAHLLRDEGVRPDVPVGIVMDRGVDLVVGVLGVLKAGGAYVPVEPQTPDRRIAEILDASAAGTCLAGPADVTRIESMGRRAVRIPAAGTPTGPDAGTHPDNLAAIYFTSGSTGTPKGVGCPHAGWVNRMRWMQRRHVLRVGETVLHKTTLTFDDAAVELFWPLSVGGRVAVLEPGAHRDPRAIIDAAIRYEAAHLQFVPSIFDLFLETLTDDDVDRLGRLRSMLCSGEALRPNLARRFFGRFGDRVSLDNTWGVTEASIDSTYHVCRPEDGSRDLQSVPIGVAIDDNDVRLLDPTMRPVPDGRTGEVYVGGIGLARGYVNEPGRTAPVFVPDPAGRGARLYRTGDLAVRRPDGSLLFLGRADTQVKIRGVRIELGEVEAALGSHPGVAAAAAVAVPDESGGKRLAAFVVAGATGVEPLRASELREHLAGRLTGYAIPSTISLVEHLPLLPNGKVDRRALAARPPEPEPEPGAEPYVAPRTAAEQTVAAIWGAVLGGSRISVHRDFFEAGGNSLLAIRILSRLRQAYDLDLPIKQIFELPTIADTAARVEQLLQADLAETENHQPPGKPARV